VAFDRTPQRIVSLQPSATVVLAAIGKADRIVACTKYCADVCPEIRNRGVTIIADSWTASTDQIVGARPDLVIAAVPYQEKAVTEILKSGSRFLGLAPKTLADIYIDIAAIAGIMGAPDRGEQVIQQMLREIEATRQQPHGANRPRVFCEEWGKPLICSQPWVAELVAVAGGEFVGTPGKQTSADGVLAQNPDVVIFAWCGAGDRVPLKNIIRDRGWEQMRAAKQHRVYCIRDEFLNTPAPTLILGLQALAAAIHPEDFPQASGLRCISELGLSGELISQ
jgi:iron complex transport system substrate-binding protein